MERGRGMKKGIKIGIGIIFAVALLIVVIFITQVGGAEISEVLIR